jgi:hypothetical protein
VDDLLFETSTSDDIALITDMLLERESIYLDPKTISKNQVIKLLEKLQRQLFPACASKVDESAYDIGSPVSQTLI